jgi:Carboxypeptidase regulatory-like domain
MNKSVAAFAALLLFAGLAPAQTSYGSTVGTVTDATHGAIPGASVALTNIGTGERRSVPSDAAGNYQFVNLISGIYRLQVESPGFKTIQSRGDPG